MKITVKLPKFISKWIENQINLYEDNTYSRTKTTIIKLTFNQLNNTGVTYG